jgi:8-oxo-dGTP pyrophosphatase MutT (NUDIX family)
LSGSAFAGVVGALPLAGLERGLGACLIAAPAQVVPCLFPGHPGSSSSSWLYGVSRSWSAKAVGIAWQFPAGIVKPGEHAEDVAVRETLAETGIHCSVTGHIGGRLHPVTGVLCDYFRCPYLAGDAANLDNVENAAVVWAPRHDVARFIERSHIYPPVLMILEDRRDPAVR